MHFIYVLRRCEAEFKGNRITNQMREISRQPSVQAMAWVLLDAFSQINSKNQERNSGHKDLKTFSFSTRKEACIRLRPKGVVAEESSTKIPPGIALKVQKYKPLI